MSLRQALRLKRNFSNGYHAKPINVLGPVRDEAGNRPAKFRPFCRGGVIYFRLSTTQYPSSHNRNTTMGRVTVRKAASERQKNLKKAEQDYIAGLEPSIRSAARIYVEH